MSDSNVFKWLTKQQTVVIRFIYFVVGEEDGKIKRLKCRRSKGQTTVDWFLEQTLN